MSRGKVIEFGKALHDHLEKLMKKGPGSAQLLEEEAKRLRLETAARERGDFGQKAAAALTDAASDYMASETDMDPGMGGPWSENPDALQQLTNMGSSLTGYSIIEELNDDFLHGKVRPFVEGEPIGCIQHWPRGPAPMLRTPADLYWERQKSMLELRAKNDAAMDAILRR